MTPTDEATFIELWQGASYRELAAALRCPLGTVASRSAALVAQGKITPRPRGGAYPRRKVLARQEGAPTPPAYLHGTRTTRGTRDPRDDVRRRPRNQQELLSLVKDLHASVGAAGTDAGIPRAARSPRDHRPTRVPRVRTEGHPAVDRALVEGLDRAYQSGRV